MFNKLAPIAFVAFAMTSASVLSASAQTTTATGVTFSGSATQAPADYSINLGSSGLTGLVSNMPMSINYGAVTVSAAFTGSSGVYSGSSVNSASPTGVTGNYFTAVSGSVSLDFSSELKRFSMQWGTPDATTNGLAFYNGSTLIASYSGADRIAMGGTYSDFSFAETGFTRVVATGGKFEFANVTFGDAVAAPDAAPIPLNAASLGGLMSFLMMLAMRGKGGTQVAIRMAFASLMPRRRGLA